MKKIAIITGASSGMGKEFALQISQTKPLDEIWLIARRKNNLEEIATSMQKVAATSHTVGVSMEQVSSIIATVSSVTRESAESIGTSYKTIFARIGDLKLGGEDEDGIGLGKVSEGL
jgi:short-subunit dehydrogenase